MLIWRCLRRRRCQALRCFTHCRHHAAGEMLPLSRRYCYHVFIGDMPLIIFHHTAFTLFSRHMLFADIDITPLYAIRVVD